MNRNDQENFWATTYSKNYISKNSNFDNKLLLKGWKKILAKVDDPKSILECGANIGRNIKALEYFFPDAKKTAIEISSDATKILKENFPSLNVCNQSILESSFKKAEFDLVFTMTVLIHINPKELLQNLKTIVSYSSKYVVIGEYFNRTPVSILYQDQEEKLFKRDFGKYIIENFKDEMKLLDYGFLWGHIFDNGGFDDITWWVFEKK